MEDRLANGVNTFGHNSPNHGSPSDRAYIFGHRNQAFTDNWSVLENLGGRGFNSDRTVDNHLDGWLNSSLHRANILNESIISIGVGLVEGGSLVVKFGF